MKRKPSWLQFDRDDKIKLNFDCFLKKDEKWEMEIKENIWRFTITKCVNDERWYMKMKDKI